MNVYYPVERFLEIIENASGEDSLFSNKDERRKYNNISKQEGSVIRNLPPEDLEELVISYLQIKQNYYLLTVRDHLQVRIKDFQKKICTACFSRISVFCYIGANFLYRKPYQISNRIGYAVFTAESKSNFG